MRNHHTLDASIDDAVHMIRAGLATVEEAAKACGTPVRALQAHLTGSTSKQDRGTYTKHGLTGSTRQHSRHSETTRRNQPPLLKPKPHATDHFIFYQKDGRWLWNRVAESGKVVRACRCDFRFYLDCVTDAKKHGWNGTAWSFLAG